MRRKLFVILLIFSLFILGTIVFTYFYFASELPKVSILKDIRLQTPFSIYTEDGRLIGEFGKKRRTPVKPLDIPEQLIQAFLAIEDDRFFEHSGIDYAGILRATYVLISTGEKKQGGSTITMQLARNYFLSSERTYTRKIKEMILALQIESHFTKEEILSLYLNKVFLGHRAYGIGAAADVYYGKTVDELRLAQIAMIAGLPKAPSNYNPLSYPSRAKKRRNIVLKRMLDLTMITANEYETAKAEPVTAVRHQKATDIDARYVAEMVRAEMIKHYGNAVYTSGYKVITTLNGDYQKHANASLRKGLLAYDIRHGYRAVWKNFDLNNNIPEEILIEYAPIGNLIPAIVTEVSNTTASAVIKNGDKIFLDEKSYTWARKKVHADHRALPPDAAGEVIKTGDLIWLVKASDSWRIRQIPDVAGAIVNIDSNNGAILALSGGFDFRLNKFNRAVQAKRQPGSSFKPFIYSAALEKGYTPASIINDAPVVFGDEGTKQGWRPDNYSNRFFGPTRLREALKKSRNLIAIRLVDSMGVDNVIEYLKRFGFKKEDLPRNLTLALGSGIISPLELASAYAPFSNGGFKITPYIIDQIYDGDNLIFEAEVKEACLSCVTDDYIDIEYAQTDMSTESSPTLTQTNPEYEKYAQRIISPSNAYQITSMMQDVISGGTARRARKLQRNDLAGKTGTTNNQHDAWFSGFTRNIVTTVWVGFDDNQPLGSYETGSRAALPIWINFMQEILKGKPEKTYYKPKDIVFARINPKTGLLAHPSSTNAIIETFRNQYVPKEVSASPDEKNNKKLKTEDIF